MIDLDRLAEDVADRIAGQGLREALAAALDAQREPWFSFAIGASGGDDALRALLAVDAKLPFTPEAVRRVRSMQDAVAPPRHHGCEDDAGLYGEGS